MWRKNPTGKGLEDILKANEGETVPGPRMIEHNLGIQVELGLENLG